MTSNTTTTSSANATYSNSSSSAPPFTLHLTVLVPSSFDPSAVQQESILAVVVLALSQRSLSDNPITILPSMVVVNDTQEMCAIAAAERIVPSSAHAVLFYTSPACIRGMAPILSAADILQLVFEGVPVDLDNTTLYPLLFSAVPSELAQADALAAIIEYYGWGLLNIFYTTEKSQVVDRLFQQFALLATNITIATVVQINSTDTAASLTPTFSSTVFQEQLAGVSIVVGESPMYEAVLGAAVAGGAVGPGWTWVGSVPDGASLDDYNIPSALFGMISINYPGGVSPLLYQVLSNALQDRALTASSSFDVMVAALIELGYPLSTIFPRLVDLISALQVAAIDASLFFHNSSTSSNGNNATLSSLPINTTRLLLASSFRLLTCPSQGFQGDSGYFCFTSSQRTPSNFSLINLSASGWTTRGFYSSIGGLRLTSPVIWADGTTHTPEDTSPLSFSSYILLAIPSSLTESESPTYFSLQYALQIALYLALPGTQVFDVYNTSAGCIPLKLSSYHAVIGEIDPICLGEFVSHPDAQDLPFFSFSPSPPPNIADAEVLSAGTGNSSNTTNSSTLVGSSNASTTVSPMASTNVYNVVPQFFSPLSSSYDEASSMLQVIQYFGWRRVGLLFVAGDGFCNSFSSAFMDSASASGLDVLALSATSYVASPTLSTAPLSFQSSSNSSFTAASSSSSPYTLDLLQQALDTLRSQRYAVNVVCGAASDTSSIIQYIRSSSMAISGYTWLGTTSFTFSLTSSVGPGFIGLLPSLNFSLYEQFINYRVENGLNMHNIWRGTWINTMRFPDSSVRRVPPSAVAPLSDCVTALAIALNQSISDSVLFLHSSVVNVRKAILSYIPSINSSASGFNGVEGRIWFDDTGFGPQSFIILASGMQTLDVVGDINALFMQLSRPVLWSNGANSSFFIPSDILPLLSNTNSQSSSSINKLLIIMLSIFLSLFFLAAIVIIAVRLRQRSNDASRAVLVKLSSIGMKDWEEPRLLSRSNVTKLSRIGSGAFGDVCYSLGSV